jgi:asparagine synthase (glutamine-hydrolysing)
MSQWLSGDFGLQIRDSLLGSSLMARGFFKVAYVEKLIADHRSGRQDNSLFIWTLYNLSAWFDYWIAGNGRSHSENERSAPPEMKAAAAAG